MGAVVVQRQRIDDAAAGEGQPCLPRQERNRFGNAQPEVPSFAGQEAGGQQSGRKERVAEEAFHKMTVTGLANLVADCFKR